MGQPHWTVEDYEAVCQQFYSESTRKTARGVLDVKPEWAIDRLTGRYLFDLVVKNDLHLTFEIGLAQGASALHFCAAHKYLQSGIHIALDPFQREYFDDMGLISMERFGLGNHFQLARQRSEIALPALKQAGIMADLVFIDGDHRFDAVFVDYANSNAILREGGFMIFDEAGVDNPTAHVFSFVEKNMSNYTRVESPTRLYVLKKTGPDIRGFGHQVPF